MILKKSSIKKYTLKEKLHILNLVQKYEVSKHEIENLYGFSRKSVLEWEEQEEELRDSINKAKRFRLKGGGKKPENLTIEPQLCTFIDISHRLGIGITTNEIIIKSIELMPV